MAHARVQEVDQCACALLNDRRDSRTTEGGSECVRILPGQIAGAVALMSVHSFAGQQPWDQQKVIQIVRDLTQAVSGMLDEFKRQPPATIASKSGCTQRMPNSEAARSDAPRELQR